MREYVQVPSFTETLVSVSCDRCGRKATDEIDAQAIEPIKIMWGYGSKFDLECWEFDLCDTCLEEITKDIRVVKTSYL